MVKGYWEALNGNKEAFEGDGKALMDEEKIKRLTQKHGVEIRGVKYATEALNGDGRR